MNAAHDATGIPLTLGQGLNRCIGVGYSGLEEDVKVKPADGDDPEQEEADGTEVIERIEPVAEGGIEQRLDAHEQPLHAALQAFDHRPAARLPSRTARITTTTKSRPPMMAMSPPNPISPIPAISPLVLSTCSAPATLRCTP